IDCDDRDLSPTVFEHKRASPQVIVFAGRDPIVAEACEINSVVLRIRAWIDRGIAGIIFEWLPRVPASIVIRIRELLTPDSGLGDRAVPFRVCSKGRDRKGRDSYLQSRLHWSQGWRWNKTKMDGRGCKNRNDRSRHYVSKRTGFQSTRADERAYDIDCRRPAQERF